MTQAPAAAGTARTIVPGLVATVVVALAATYLSDHYRAPPVIFALLLGMALNALAWEPRYTPGIDLSARALLRLSVALLGLRITFSQVGELGWSTAALVIVAVPATIGFGWVFARAFKLDGRFGVLSGGAVGICGASAAMAIAVAWPRQEISRCRRVFRTITAGAPPPRWPGLPAGSPRWPGRLPGASARWSGLCGCQSQWGICGHQRFASEPPDEPYHGDLTQPECDP